MAAPAGSIRAIWRRLLTEWPQDRSSFSNRGRNRLRIAVGGTRSYSHRDPAALTVVLSILLLPTSRWLTRSPATNATCCRYCPSCRLGGKASCSRVWLHPRDPSGRSDRAPARARIAALLVLIVANTAPLMGLSAVGRHASTTIIGGAYQMWHRGTGGDRRDRRLLRGHRPRRLSALPADRAVGGARPPAPRWVGDMLRWAERMRPWAMVEVMMLGILVALIKIADLAKVEAGIGMFAVGVLMLLFPAILSSSMPRRSGRGWPGTRPIAGSPSRPPAAEARA
jgi:paraquat-inducible protein A